MIEALSDEDSSVRVEVAKALGAYAHPASVEPLAKALARLSQTSKTRRTADGKGPEIMEPEALAAALGRLGAPAVTPLIRLLKSDDREVRRWVAFALGQTGDLRAIEPLAERLEDNRSEVRKAAAHALGALGNPSVLAPLKKGLASRDPETRRVAAEALGAIGGEGAAAALAAATWDESESVQLTAIEALRKIGGLQAGRGLRGALEAGRRKSVNDAASSALKAMAFNPATAEERAAAAVLMGDFDAAVREGRAATEALVEALDSRDPRRRLQAAEALRSLHPDGAVPFLVKALKDYDSKVRETAADALAGIGLPALESLNASLESPDTTVVCLAARALGKVGDERAAGALAGAIARNRSATSANPEPLEAMRAAAASLEAILSPAATKVTDEHLERIASVPDGWLEHPEGESEEARRPERVVDCTRVRELARRELARRGRC